MRMLPAWATVTLAIGGAVIGALAGITGSYFGLRGTRLTLMYQESEAWRTVLVDAVQRCSDPWMDLGFLLTPAAGGAAALTKSDQHKVTSFIVAIAQALARATLLFGDDSPAGKAADEFQTAVATVSATALFKPIPWDAATTKTVANLLHEADGLFDMFIREAHLAIRPPDAKLFGLNPMTGLRAKRPGKRGPSY